jgi:endo-1,4-beta-xylanase
VHGHVLVFGEALPSWVNSMPTTTTAQKAAVQTVLTQYATAIGTRYRGAIGEWDIDEVFSDNAKVNNMGQAYKKNIWYRAMGANYPVIAAKALSAADPSAHVFVNEYGLEQDGGSRFKAVLSALDTWKQAGANIYGVGLESHIFDVSTDLIVNTSGQAPQLDANIATLAAKGLKTRISELDAPVTDAYGGSSQSAQFVGILSSCLKNTSCFTWSTWSTGPTDLYQEGTTLQPVGEDSMFLPDMTPTAAYTAVQNALK